MVAASKSDSGVLPAKPSASSSSSVELPKAPERAPAPRSQPASPFHIVADTDYYLKLQRLGNTAMFTADQELLTIRGNTVTFEPAYALSKEVRGDGFTGFFQSVHGIFPDAMFAAVVRPTGRTGFTELYKWSGSKWVSHYSSDQSTSVLDIQPWQNGTALMVETQSFSGEYRFTVLPKGSKVFVPAPNSRRWQAASNFCVSGFIPEAFRTLTTGHAFMAGSICPPEGSGSNEWQPGIKRFSPEDKAGTADVLPEIGSKALYIGDIAPHSATNVYVGGNTAPSRYGVQSKVSPYLAHFDGKSWTRDTLPFSDGLSSLDIGADETLWAVSKKGAVFSRPKNGAWAEVPLPNAGGEDARPIEATAVWSRGPGDEWMVGQYKSKKGTMRYVVLHSGTPVEMAKLPSIEAMADTVADLAMPTPLTPMCRTPFVLLYTLSKVAPPDFDYPATRAALKGHPEFKGAEFIEFKRLDKRFMGAFVTDAEMGKKLVELVTKKVPNSTPQLACHAPKPSRVLEIDLSAGN